MAPNINYYVRHNNNIAQKNVTVVEIGDGSVGGAVISVGNIYDVAHPFCLQFKVKEESVNLIEDTTITV